MNYITDNTLITNDDVTNAVTEESDCSTPRGVMCWKRYGK